MNRRALLFALAALGLFACSRSSTPLKTLTVDEVATRMAANDGKTFVYDNNDKARYNESHLPGARWVKFDAVTAADLPPDKTATLIFYCAHEL
jgi:hypothetical protein